MDNLTIGVLLPSSTIFPIAKDFEKGLKQGLKPLTAENIEVEIIKEFVGGGDPKPTEIACNKLLTFDDVDLVTGVISNQTLNRVAEKFQANQTPALISNLGGHIPLVDKLNEYLFLNSMHLWRHAWTLGYWGVKQFGKKGMFAGAVYDAGYGFSQMFHEGMIAADEQADWSFSVPPMPPAGGRTDMNIIFPFIDQYQPDFIFAAFCGDETTLFLNEFIARGYHHRIKLLGLPYLLAPFKPLNDDVTIYTTLPFEDDASIEPAGAFFELGLRAGKNISTAVKGSATKADLRNALATQNNMFTIPGTITDNGQLTLVEHKVKAGQSTFNSQPLEQTHTFPFDTALMQLLTATPGSGWFNPYLGI